MLRFVNICLVLGLVALGLCHLSGEIRGPRARRGDRLSRQGDRHRAGLRSPCCAPNGACSIALSASSGWPQKFLKLAPVQPRQFVTVYSVSDRDFTRQRVEVATTTPVRSATTGQGAKAAAKVPTTVGAVTPLAMPVPAAAAWPAAKVHHPAASRRPVVLTRARHRQIRCRHSVAPSVPISRVAAIASAWPALPSLSAFVLIGGPPRQPRLRRHRAELRQPARHFLDRAPPRHSRPERQAACD